MLYLFLGVLCSTVIAILMRISGNYTDDRKNVSMLTANYAVCSLLAFYYNGIGNLLPVSGGMLQSLGLGIINGFFYLAGFVLLQFNTLWNGVTLSSTFMRLGVLVPTTVSMLFFHEKPGPLQSLGFLLALAAIIGISTAKKEASAERKSGTTAILGLLLLLLSGGAGDAMSKVFEEIGNPAFSDTFLTFTFIFAFLLSILLMVIRKQGPGMVEILFGIVIAVPNYYSARFLLKALGTVPAFICCPTYSVSTIVLTSLAGMLFFREKINRRQFCCIGIILLAVALLNL